MTLTLLLSGCFRYHGAEGGAPATVPVGGDAWVGDERTDGLERLVDTPRELVIAEIDREKLRSFYPELSEAEIDLFESRLRVPLRVSRLVDGGIVRFWGRNDAATREAGTLNLSRFSSILREFGTDGAYLSTDELAWLEARDAIGTDDTGEKLAAYFASARGIRLTNVKDAWRLEDGIRLGLPDPGEDEPGQRVGTVLHIASYYENKYEHRVLERLKGYGWAIAHMDPEISLRGPNAIAQYERRRLQREQRRAMLDEDPEYQRINEILRERRPTQEETDLQTERVRRAWERVREAYPDLDSGFEVRPDTDLEAHGRMIAEHVDRRVAAHAYAAEALIEESDRLDPALADGPIVVMGFSAGALAAPAVALRLHEAYPDRAIAIVMVGGGGDLLSAAEGSVFTDGGIDLKPRDGAEPTQDRLDELIGHYRAASRLDPLSVAPVIRDLPTLHIYAARDTVVPADTARAFNEAHGSVDRLVHPFNHDTLFFFLPGEVGRIRSWMRSHGLID